MAKTPAADPSACALPQSGGRRSGGEPRIETPADYAAAVAEVARLEAAPEGSGEFLRRQALRAAMHDFERRHMAPDCKRGRPR